MSTTLDPAPPRLRYQWATRGDINAFFGLMLDNIGDMILMASLLVGVFGFPSGFVLTSMIPGTAVGVMVGDLIFTAMAFRLAKRSGRTNVTAMPLGLDTPSTFGSVFLVLGPAFIHAKSPLADGGLGLAPIDAARHAWFIGIAMLLASGVFKLVCAIFSGWIRRHVPRAGLLGSLAAIALVIISFLPLLDIASVPVAGFAALAVILATLTARWELPWKVPGALGALLIGCGAMALLNLAHYAANKLGFGPLPLIWSEGQPPRPGVPCRVADAGLGVAIVVPEFLEGSGGLPAGGDPAGPGHGRWRIDCAESAAEAGDDYPTGPIIAAEGIATLFGGLFGGVIQSTPYIGHPAYKAMGARAAYTLATALFVGSAGILGYFDWIFYLVPKAVVFPILIFVGLEIASQSFKATQKSHYPALALACVPALAYLVLIPLNQVLGASGKAFTAFPPLIQHQIQTLTMLSGGFIVTSLLWATALAKVIDGRMKAAAITFALAALFALFGVIHSPLPSAPIASPPEVVRQLKQQGRFEASSSQTPYHWAAAYLGMAGVLLWLGRMGGAPTPDEEMTEPSAD